MPALTVFMVVLYWHVSVCGMVLPALVFMVLLYHHALVYNDTLVSAPKCLWYSISTISVYGTVSALVFMVQCQHN